jgi:hypothetical protein
VEQVTYENRGLVALIKSGDVVLRLGGLPFKEATVWVATADAFAELRRENPNVQFVEVKPLGKVGKDQQ